VSKIIKFSSYNSKLLPAETFGDWIKADNFIIMIIEKVAKRAL
jgi:hypothetical protein